MSITDHYNPIWDRTRQALPARVYEDEDIILTSDFECGNGFHFRKLPNGRYALDIEPEPGNHHFSGSGCYFCFGVLNKHETPREYVFEIASAHEAWERGREEEIDAYLQQHPDGIPPRSYADTSRFAIVRRGHDWSHVPDGQMLRARDHGAIAFSYGLPAVSDDHPALFFSNYHWYPYTEMAAYLNNLAGQYPRLAIHTLCRSVQGRDVWTVELGNTAEDAPVIVCAATPQADEMGNWACRAILEYLISGKADAKEILRRHRVCLIPHPNPDGTVLGYMVSDAAEKFPYFMGKQTIEGDPDAPIEQVALWNYLKQRRPWLFIEWHSNHWHWRPGHTLIRYAPELATDPAIRRIWDDWDQRLEALPDTYDEEGGRTDRTNAYTISLGLGVATELNGIPAMIKVHDKFPLEDTLGYVVDCFRAATDAYEKNGG